VNRESRPGLRRLARCRGSWELLVVTGQGSIAQRLATMQPGVELVTWDFLQGHVAMVKDFGSEAGVESRRGAVTVASRWRLAGFSPHRLSPV